MLKYTNKQIHNAIKAVQPEKREKNEEKAGTKNTIEYSRT